MYAPVSGEVVEVNNVLSDDPAKVRAWWHGDTGYRGHGLTA